MKEKKDPEDVEKETPDEVEEKTELSKEASTKLEELEQQVIRLRDDGLFRVELLYQLQQINDQFQQLNDFFRKLTEEGGEEKD